jgi:metallo-beta-lactamase class B
MPVEIFLTTHARKFGRYRKFLERATAKDPVQPFIDHAGYLSYIDDSEARVRKDIAEHDRRR